MKCMLCNSETDSKLCPKCIVDYKITDEQSNNTLTKYTVRMSNQNSSNSAFCYKCGETLYSKESYCSKCGQNQLSKQNNKTILIILAVIFGFVILNIPLVKCGYFCVQKHSIVKMFATCNNKSIQSKLLGKWQNINDPEEAFMFYPNGDGLLFNPTNHSKPLEIIWELIDNGKRIRITIVLVGGGKEHDLSFSGNLLKIGTDTFRKR